MILINNDMQMPKNCYECIFRDLEGSSGCLVSGDPGFVACGYVKDWDEWVKHIMHNRDTRCPLVEVKKIEQADSM